MEKAPTYDHPCNLTRTSVKISFPAMKQQVFVNFLGYKEPSLVHVMRCKVGPHRTAVLQQWPGLLQGVCGDESSPTSCSATSLVQRQVNMMVKTHFQGREEKERWKEILVEEHTSCGTPL